MKSPITTPEQMVDTLTEMASIIEKSEEVKQQMYAHADAQHEEIYRRVAATKATTINGILGVIMSVYETSFPHGKLEEDGSVSVSIDTNGASLTYTQGDNEDVTLISWDDIFNARDAALEALGDAPVNVEVDASVD